MGGVASFLLRTGPVTPIGLFGSVAFVFVIGCGGKAQTSDGAAGTTGTGGTGGALPPAMGTPGVWENVTSPDMPASLFTGSSGFGVGNIRVDPARPSDVYVGGYGSI